MTRFARRVPFLPLPILFLFALFSLFVFAPSFSTPAHAQTTAQGTTVITLTVLNPVATTTYSVTVVKNGSGTGTVTSTDGGIICGSICFESNIANGSSTVLTATADPGSVFMGWNVSTDPLACPGIGICTVSTTTVVTATFNLNNSPSTPPTSPVVGSPSGPSQFFFEDFSSSESTSSAIIDWYTSIPSLSEVSWGLNSDGANGTGSETAYNISHSIELDNLTPNTSYVLNITAGAQDGRVIYYSYPFTTLPMSNTIPLNVTNFTAQQSFGGNILLSWNNPPEPDFSYVLITRGTRFYPRDPNEGYIVYQGSEEEALDTDAVPGQVYYYTAFAITTAGDHSSGTILEYELPMGLSSPTGTGPTGSASTSSSTSIFGGTPGTVGTTGTGGTTSSSSINVSQSILSKINFIQDDKLIPEIDSTVLVNASLSILVEIPASVVPLYTEETTVTVGRGTPLQQTFMFEKLSDGSLEAFIPAILPTGSTPFSINFLQIGSQVRVDGTFIASGNPAPFVPQGIFSYLYQTFISYNFLCTTVPVILMFFEAIIAIIILVLIIGKLLKSTDGEE